MYICGENENEFEQGDKVKLITHWYEENGFPYIYGDIYIVEYQDGENVETNKGEFPIQELEIVK